MSHEFEGVYKRKRHDLLGSIKWFIDIVDVDRNKQIAKTNVWLQNNTDGNLACRQNCLKGQIPFRKITLDSCNIVYSSLILSFLSFYMYRTLWHSNQQYLHLFRFWCYNILYCIAVLNYKESCEFETFYKSLTVLCIYLHLYLSICYVR